MSYNHPHVAVDSPGQSADKLVWQDSKGDSVDVDYVPRPNIGSPYTGLTVAFKFDQAVTFIQKWGPLPTTADSDLVIINGASATGETASANTFFSRLVWLQPGRNRISVLAGGTAPTAAKIALSLYSGPLPFVGIV